LKFSGLQDSGMDTLTLNLLPKSIFNLHFSGVYTFKQHRNDSENTFSEPCGKKSKTTKITPIYMQNKINKMTTARKPLKISQNPSNLLFQGALLSSFPQGLPNFLGLPQKKFFVFNF